MNLPEFLVDHPDGEIRLTGHRISLYNVANCYQKGYSPEMIREEFPTIPLALIYKVIAFCLENQKEVDAYVSAYRAELIAQEAAHVPSAAAERIRKSILAKARNANTPVQESL